MFYKFENSELLSGSVIHTPSGSLTEETKDDFTYPILGWSWYDDKPTFEFEEWEKRFDAVSTLKILVNNSPLGIRPYIISWYESKIEEVNNFIKNGDAAFRETIAKGDEFWWDLVGGNGTVRAQALAVIDSINE